MSTNGNANGHSCNGVSDVLQWKVGLISNTGNYLTAETFGYNINASGQGLKKKQTWILEQDPNKDTVLYIKSHLGRYISADKYGTVTCDKEADEREDCHKFTVEYAKDGSGKWAFKNEQNSLYFGINKDNEVKCFSKTFSDPELWTVQLATHPQMNLRNVNRKRFAILCDDEIQCKEVVPWGEACLLLLHFDSGKYGLKTCDDRFLHRDGTLVDKLDDDSKFTLEIRSCGLAFKDCKGYYLTAVGSTATMKGGKNKSVGKDELFTLECSHPQVTITSQNKKLVSVKQGVDLSANQSEMCNETIFQMELEKHTRKWAFCTCVDNKYWSLESFGGIQAASRTKSAKSLFSVESNGDGSVCIRSSNNNPLYNKQTGSILCNVENPDSKNFVISMVNRPYLILKCDFGFVGLKPSSSKPELICSKTGYSKTFIEPQEDGYYYLKGENDKYWTVGEDNSLSANGDTPTCKFLLEFHDQSQMTIKAPNGKYLKGELNSFMAKGEEVEPLTVWEY